jgi:hypothetical protein
MRILLPSLLLLAACMEGTGLQCPANTSTVGQYSLAFTAVHDAGECIAVDGGAQNKVTLDNVAAKDSMLCVGTGPDGGPQPELLVAEKGGARVLDLDADGGFHLGSNAGTNQTTPCNCEVNVFENFDGFLQSGGTFALRPDGGLPALTGITATLVDHLTPVGTGCICSFPCTVTYTIKGTPF